MAVNLRNQTKSDYCISTTGIAGPTGNSKSKRIGLAYIAIAYNKGNYSYKMNFRGTRIQIQKKITKAVFKILNNNM